MTVGRHTQVVAVLHSGEAGSALGQQCKGLNGTKIDIQVGRLEDVRPGTGRFARADALLLELDPQNAEEFEQLDDIVHTRFPQTPIVVTAEDLSLLDVRRLMRLGVADFVPQPIEVDELMASVSHAIQQRRAGNADAVPGGKVIAFCKCAGGVGATTLAVQAGYLIAKRYKEREQAVCLIDLDIQFGNAGLYLDIDHCNDIPGLVDEPDRLDPTLLNGLLNRHASGLTVLASPRDVIPLDTLTPEFASALVDLSSREYDHVLLDMPGAWTDWTIAALERCNQLVLVTQLTVAGIRQARLQLDTMQAQGLGAVPTKIVLNRFQKGWGKSVSVKESEKVLGRKFDILIPNDYATVSEATNQGLPLEKLKKRTKVEKSIEKLVDSFSGTTSSEDERREPHLV